MNAVMTTCPSHSGAPNPWICGVVFAVSLLPALAQAEELPSSATGFVPEVVNSIGMRFVYIAPGEFEMGVPNPGASAPPDVPPHVVRITKPFYIAACEASQADFEQVMGFNPSIHSPSAPPLWKTPSRALRDLPVENVSWLEAVEYGARLSRFDAEKEAGRSYRLPTEAEWEFACRSFGGNVSATEARDDLPVRDMTRSVAEWCSDWYLRDYYALSLKKNPVGPNSGSLKVVRGSAWIFTGIACRLNHMATPPWQRSRFIGFRLVFDAK
jgi:formylglycine-generating enzyme required for sulfatase activity